jgi:hypothetical protein
MTYWGAPSPGGSKFYLGSSGDTAWNHDILWKSRVEKEVAELDPEADEVDEGVYSDDKYLAGVSDRQWEPHELEKLKDGIRVHGAGNFQALLGNPKFSSLRNHSEQALKEQWRHMEYMRSKSLDKTMSAWRKPTESQKRALSFRQRQNEQKRRQQKGGMNSPNKIRMSWRGSGQFKLPPVPLSPMNVTQRNRQGHQGGGGSQQMRESVRNLKSTLRKETMRRDELKRTLGEQQKQRDSTHLDLLQERKRRRQAENALRKYQSVLARLAQQRGIIQSPTNPTHSSPLLNSAKRVQPNPMSTRRDQLKRMLVAAENGGMSHTKSVPLLNTQSSGFF